VTTRRDLAAALSDLTRNLVAAELPILRTHRLSMWAYVVLSALDEGPVRSQAALAQAIRADKTRIITTLDTLQSAGLITREPDPADRRIKLLAITPAGHRARIAAQTSIQENEDRILSSLSAADRRGFLRAVRILSDPSGTILNG
jgi:DNA-binding MarR family transcriptional regulator